MTSREFNSLRHAQNWTQMQVAALCDVSVSTVCTWCHGTRSVPDSITRFLHLVTQVPEAHGEVIRQGWIPPRQRKRQTPIHRKNTDE